MKITTRCWIWRSKAVSLRSAWLISRACRPGNESPISPSSSALGVSAATESMTTMSTPPRRTQGVGDLQRLLACVRLRDQHFIDVHAQLAGIAGVQRMLGIHISGDATLLLGFRNNVQRAKVVLPEDSGP